MKNSDKLISIFNKLNIDYVSGYNWTIDAIYKETIAKYEKRKEDGCISVDMEASGLEAISRYLNINLYIFFFAGDMLGTTWDSGNLIGDSHKKSQLGAFNIAIDVAKNI